MAAILIAHARFRRRRAHAPTSNTASHELAGAPLLQADFKPKTTRYESVNFGISTIDPHIQKEHTEIHKISKFSVNQASFD